MRMYRAFGGLCFVKTIETSLRALVQGSILAATLLLVMYLTGQRMPWQTHWQTDSHSPGHAAASGGEL